MPAQWTGTPPKRIALLSRQNRQWMVLLVPRAACHQSKSNALSIPHVHIKSYEVISPRCTFEHCVCIKSTEWKSLFPHRCALYIHVSLCNRSRISDIERVFIAQSHLFVSLCRYRAKAKSARSNTTVSHHAFSPIADIFLYPTKSTVCVFRSCRRTN